MQTWRAEKSTGVLFFSGFFLFFETIKAYVCFSLLQRGTQPISTVGEDFVLNWNYTREREKKFAIPDPTFFCLCAFSHSMSVATQLDEAIAAFRAFMPVVEPNYTHEVSYLQQFSSAQSVAVDPAVSSFDRPADCTAAVFGTSQGHDCRQSGCRVVSLPLDVTTYACPLESHHPRNEPRQPDGSILHRATHEVYICPSTGKVHICNRNRCEYKYQPSGEGVGEYVCPLTARVLGCDMINTVEYKDGRQFGDGEVMTWQEHIDRANLLESYVVDEFERARPDNVEASQNEIKDAAQNQQRREALLSLPARAATLALTGAPQRLAITDRKKRSAENLPKPARKLVPLREVSDQALEKFTADIQRFFDALKKRLCEETALAAVMARADETADRIKIDAKRHSGRATQGRTKHQLPLKLTPAHALATFDAMMMQVLDDYEWVCTIANDPPWKSGAIIQDRTPRLLERMRLLWRIYISNRRSVPAKTFQHVGLPMLGVLCHGYVLAVNAVKTSTTLNGVTTHSMTLYTHREGRKKINLTLVEPDPYLSELSQLSLISPLCSGSDSAMKATTGIHACFNDLFAGGVPLESVKELIVPHLCMETDDKSLSLVPIKTK